jgi:hypothetical protein
VVPIRLTSFEDQLDLLRAGAVAVGRPVRLAVGEADRTDGLAEKDIPVDPFELGERQSKRKLVYIY